MAKESAKKTKLDVASSISFSADIEKNGNDNNRCFSTIEETKKDKEFKCSDSDDIVMDNSSSLFGGTSLFSGTNMDDDDDLLEEEDF
eukprot:10327814-Ditylum_brightwellii.AAC.1